MSALHTLVADLQLQSRTGRLLVYLGSVLFFTSIQQYVNRRLRRRRREHQRALEQDSHGYHQSPTRNGQQSSRAGGSRSSSPKDKEQSRTGGNSSRSSSRSGSPNEKDRNRSRSPDAGLLGEMEEAEEQQDVMVVGIAGGSGSGKTTLATAIYEALGRRNCSYIMHDSYYKDASHMTLQQREKLNFDHPDALETELLVEHIKMLRDRQVAFVPTYDFATHSRTKQRNAIHPRPIILVEGILIFHHPELCELFDLKVFVDTDDDIRLIRRMQRDTAERGRSLTSVIDQYMTTVRPMYHKYVKASMGNADMIIPHGINPKAHDCIVTKLKDFIANGYSDPLTEFF